MDSSTLLSTLFFYFLILILAPVAVSGANSNLFVEYIGAQDHGVKFSNVPIKPRVNFHFICSFAIDYSVTTSTPTPTNGKFGVFWDKINLSPNAVSAIKQKHSNVKVAASLGGASISKNNMAFQVNFTATSIKTWVSNAVSSLTTIIHKYHLDGIDIDYENFSDERDTEKFTECIGQLITTLKKNGVISFASIAPFDDPPRIAMYHALWAKYSGVIDYVNYMFYGYNEATTIDDYVKHFDDQVAFYRGGKVLASFMSNAIDATRENSFSPDTGFAACKKLKSQCKLYGIFIWSADSSLNSTKGFTYESKSQALLASATGY